MPCHLCSTLYIFVVKHHLHLIKQVMQVLKAVPESTLSVVKSALHWLDPAMYDFMSLLYHQMIHSNSSSNILLATVQQDTHGHDCTCSRSSFLICSADLREGDACKGARGGNRVASL